MTYPPQQPYGQQPDPHGQGQQPGQYGGYQTPSGGYPQQGGQRGGYEPTAQYPNPQYPNPQYPNPQYGGFPGGEYGGGYYGGPPPQKKTGMIVAVVSIVVLLLAGVGVTGFVAPGFFLSDKENSAGSGGTGTSTSPSSKDDGADEFVDELVRAADGRDSAALKELACADAEPNVQLAIEDIGDITGAELKETREVSDSEVTAVLDITVDGESEDYEAAVVKDGKDWCWNDISRSGGGDLPTGEPTPGSTGVSEPPTGGGSGGSGDGEEFVQGFLDTLNGGDAAGAKGKLCQDSKSQGDVDEAIKGKANLQMDPAGKEAQPEYVGVDLKGTLNGAPTDAARTSAFLQDSGWCILTFYAF